MNEQMKLGAVGVVAAALLAASVDPASALSLRLTDTDTAATVQLNDGDVGPPPDLDAAPFELTFDCTSCGWIGNTNWSSVVVSGEVTPAPGVGGPKVRQLNLTVDAESTTTANLKVEISHTGLTLASLPTFWNGFHQATGNITGQGGFTVEAFWDPGNALWATTNSIGGLLSGGSGVTALLVTDKELGVNTPFSMTTVMTLSHSGASTSALNTSQAGLSPVPLPAAGWMLLAGLAGLGAIARRKAA